jgi:hypothetical protein
MRVTITGPQRFRRDVAFAMDETGSERRRLA